jgi:hypothetical protein
MSVRAVLVWLLLMALVLFAIVFLTTVQFVAGIAAAGCVVAVSAHFVGRMEDPLEGDE